MVLGGFTHSAETFPILGVFLKPITEEFGWTRSQFTGAMTIGTVLGSVIAVGIGPMLDRYGGRWLMTIGFIVLGFSFLLMGGMSTIWHFYVLQIAGRMFHMGIISVGMMVIVPQWFVLKRGKAVGVSGLGSRFGGTVWPLVTQALVTSVGWRFASLAVGSSALLFGALPAAIFLRRRPEDMGLRPDGAPQAENGIDGKFLKGVPVRDDVSLTVRQVVRTRAFYLITASFSMLFLASSATNLHLIPHLTDQKISTQVAVIVVSMWGVGAFLGGFIAGLLSDRISARWLAFGQALTMAAGYAGLIFISSGGFALAWGLAYGFFHGWNGPLQQVMLADYFGRDSLGAIRGITWPFQALSNAIGPITASLVFDTQGTYTPVFASFVGISVLSSVLFLFSRKPKI